MSEFLTLIHKFTLQPPLYWNLFYPVHGANLTRIQPMWSAYPYDLVFLIGLALGLYGIRITFSLCGIRITWFSLYGIHITRFPSYGNAAQTFKCICTIVLDTALLWAAMDAALSQGPQLWRHNNKTIIVSWNAHGPEGEPRRGNCGLSIDLLFVGFQKDLFYISMK